VLFFKRLLSFKRGSKLSDKRGDQRHPVGAGFPLKGSVSLVGRDLAGKATSSRESGVSWSGRPANLSGSGLSLQLPSAALTARGEETELVLTLEAHRLVIPCKVAHFRVYNTHAVCGLALRYDNPEVEAAYRQLLETVGIGASFTGVKSLVGGRTPPGVLREQYQAANKFLLTAWRDAASRELTGFELLLGDFCVRGETVGKEIEIYSRQKQDGSTAKTALSAPSLSLSTGVHGEVRQLYRWVVLNLTKAVPSDLRAMLERFIRKSDILAPTP
jgi:hypothetical protein